MDISLENLFVDMGLTGLSEHYVLPENIHTPPTEGIGNSWGVEGGGDAQRPKKLSKCIKLDRNFQRGGGSKGKSLLWGRYG